MKENSQTVLWNDSADPKELKDALTWGIVVATLRTLRGFLQSTNDLEAFVRDTTVPNPDK